MVAGKWLPEVRTAAGLTPVDPTVGEVAVDLVVTSVTPTSFTEAGGEVVDILGSGFPASLETSDFTQFAFADGTICTLISSTPTAM